MEESMKRETLVRWGAAFLVPVLILCLPSGEVFTPVLKKFLSVTVFGLLLMALELAPSMCSAIIFPIGYVLFDVAPIQTVLAPWIGTTALVIVCGFWLAMILLRTGLLDRVICRCAIFFGGSFTGIAVSIYLAGVIASFVTFGGHHMLILAFAYGACRTLDLQRGTAATVLLMSAVYTTIFAQQFSYYPGVLALLNGSIANIAPEYQITWLSNLILGLPMFFVGLAGVIILSRMFAGDVTRVDIKQHYIEMRDKQGPMTGNEKKGIAVMLCLLLFMATSSLHGINGDFGMILAPLIFYLPGIQVGNYDDVKGIDFDMVFLIMACMSIGSVGTHIGLGQLLTSYAIPIIGDMGAVGLLGFTWIFSVLFNFLLTPFAIYAAFSQPLGDIAFGMGINPATLMITLINAGDTILLPYEHNSALMAFAFGLMSLKGFVRVNLVKCIIQFIGMFFVMLPFWYLIGMLYV